MDLHLHLSAAFRELDRKWGQTVDLDTSTDYSTCLPAVLDLPSTTFSSEEFLKTIRRRDCKIKKYDSFSDISMSRMPSTSDLGSSEFDTSSLSNHVVFSSTETLDSSKYVFENKKNSFVKRQARSKKFISKLKAYLLKF
ncbi:unnamed protein product [Leptosia nina]|uniref:Uncharacterized protein n=1 Tax=Leptosia nina TaxID=320188 RepID=A0AAV1JJ95_9NEOP